MRDTSGKRTRQRGWEQVRAALVEPRILLAISVAVVLAVGLVAGETAVIRALGLRVPAGYPSFLLGLLCATAVLLMVGFVVAFSGGLSWLIGGEAERWTGEELAKAEHRRIFHNLVFVESIGEDTWEVDVDHVAVGRYGVLVVESKFTGQPLDLDAARLPKQLRRDAEQAARNAYRVRRVIGDRAPGIPIIPVLVYWGEKVKRPIDGTRRIGKVQVVHGADARKWLPKLVTADVPSAFEDEALRALEDHEQTTQTSN